MSNNPYKPGGLNHPPDKVKHREDLDQVTCGNPHCRHENDTGFFIHSQCHPKAPTWAYYEGGNVTITCAECHAPVLTLAVARN